LTRTVGLRFALTMAAIVVAICWAASFADGERSTAAITPSFRQTATPTPTSIVNGAQPIVAPRGERIAFFSNRGGTEDLFVINADGTGEKQLTHTPENETGLQWSADARQILFSVFTNDTSHLFAVDPDGGNQREIGSFPGRTPMLAPDGKQVVYMAGTWTATRLMVSALDGSDARQINDGTTIAWNNHWSPDGKRIAFTGRSDPNGELAVFVMNADGSGRRQVTHIAAEEGGAQWPVWSPNGRHLAIQVNSRSQKGTAHIWIVDVATGTARKLAGHGQPYLDETPSWFPDSQHIAFQSNRTGRMEVWVMNADGSGQRQVTQASQEKPKPAYYFNPDWSPDGSRVLFESNKDGRFALYTIKLDASGLQKLTSGAADDAQARWSRDGKQIVFISNRDGRDQLYLMNADGSHQRRLTNAPGGDFLPDLSPKGDQVVFTTSAEITTRTTEIYLTRTDGTDRTRLTNYGDSETGNARWSPDGRKILFSKSMILPDSFPRSSSEEKARMRAQVKNSGEIFIMDKDGSNVIDLTNNSAPDSGAYWSRDGRTIYFMSEREGTRNVYAMNVDGSNVRKVADGTVVREANVSRDGKHFVYTKEVNGRQGLYVYDVRNGTERLLIGSNGQ
jgi:Tol biopolymer transport system component